MNSPLLGLYKTSSQSIYEATCLDIIRELSKNLLEDTPTNESFTSVNGLDKCVEEINFTQGIKKIYNRYHNVENRRGGPIDDQNKGYDRWNNSMEIMKVGNFDQSIKDAVAIAQTIKNDVDTQFYGMLLISKGSKTKRIVFNPLHPVIAMELRKENNSINTNVKRWTIAIYSFKEYMEATYKDAYPHLYNNNNYMDELGTILASIDTPSEYIIENSNFKVDIVDDKFVLNYEQIKKLKDSGNIVAQEITDSRSFIVPCQVINVGGVAYPYYGIIYSTKGLAWNMTPMQSANINHSNGQSIQNGMDGGSRICTHSGNSKTQMGISSLNHCNTTSPLNSECMEDGSMSFANQSMDASFELMLDSELLVKTPKEAGKALTYMEFVEENNGATKAQYLDYIKDRMKHAMEDDKEEEEIQKHEESTTEPTYPIFDHLNTYGLGEITLDKYGKNPRILTRQPDGGTEWIPYKEPALYDVLKNYIVGDIVKEDNGSLSQLTHKKNGPPMWQTYIPPIDLTEI